jgi:hypothetical protein
MIRWPLLCLLIPLTLWASPAEEPVDGNLVLLDETQDFFSGSVTSLANRVDSFFATERADDELNRSSIRIRQTYEIRERAVGFETRRYRINLRLPHLEDKFRYDFNKKKGKSDKQIIVDKVKEQRDNRKKLFSGWTFNADTAVNIAIPPRLTARARVRKNLHTGTLVHRFVEGVTFVTDESGLTEETTLLTDHKMNDDILFRFTNYKRWRVLKKEFFTTHGPSFIQQLTEDDFISYNASINNIIGNSSFYLNSYAISISYRRNLYKNWFYLDVVPGIDFPKHWSFRRTPFTFFQLELLFGG